MEIPARVFAREAAEPAIQGIGQVLARVGLLEHGELDAVSQPAEGLDLLLCAGLLAAVVVAREAQHHQPAVPVPLVEGLEPRVLVGVGGLADVAKDDMDITPQNEDFGQTLGSYGLGHGFYLVWPFIGPSSLRDTVGFLGDRFLDPVTYVTPMEAAIGIKAFDVVNDTSFVYDQYEKLKADAYDPYLFFRDAYVQHRQKKVNE